ncbi:CpsD/CapB family tyrosine-protein kinase [Anaerosporobacter sp.]|uniref:CpsD/CapB family tyrosine-protein kinase n=1 Tax=Anaerosporobacter sp. TaxID=1872529 RepID=UPI00286EE944|nr:CpsD/CapB family tyrosine-protein kinase [Anaerosporobacter sp.]
MKFRKKRRVHVENLNSSQIIINANTSFVVFEAYKSARTTLLAMTQKEGCKVVAVTSSLPEEGKTISTINLAITMLQSGKKVLIIDADMRASKVCKYLEMPSGVGLSDYLRGSTGALAHLAYESRFGVLHVIPGGAVPDNPVELLMSDKMGKLIESLKKDYDYIFIDTPPVNVVTDAAVIYQWVSGYLLVVRAGVSDINAVKEMVLELESVHANIIGFFLHDVDFKSNGYGYGRRYRYSKYDRYGAYRKRDMYGNNDT